MKARIREMVQSAWRWLLDLLPARWHVTVDHLRFHKSFPNLSNPRTLSEKIAWRKLYERDPRMPSLVDKITSKEQMAARFGEGFVIPTLATFASESEIDFGALQYPCVIKANHGSSMNLFLMERPADEEKVRGKLGRFLRFRYHAVREEWAYSKVKPRLLVEPFLAGGEHGLVDYKIHTFHGHAYAIEIITDRYTGHYGAMFDRDWNEIPCLFGAVKAPYTIPRPVQLDRMIDIAEQIGKDFSYVRVDFYEVEGRAVFGEITFYPGGGLDVVEPEEYDEIFGRQWVMGDRGIEAAHVETLV
jgi:hypothetical protein